MTALLRRSRPYIFWGQTTSLCETCLALVPAKIAIKGNEVWYEKRCDRHGTHSTLISTDAAYWRLCKDYIKPGDRPLNLQSHTEFGCPYDCGLCPDHEQHSCLALIEINEHCNLTCPVCFADSSPSRDKHLPLPVIERMVDALVASEGEPDLVQISGGEPTLHPEFFAVLDAVRARPVRHVMVNTNGLRIAREPDFAARLAEQKRGLEIYLQFDSLRARRPDGAARRRSAARAAGGAGEPRAPQRLDHAGGHGQARRQRRRDRRDRPPRAAMALRARHHLPAGAGRRPQRELRQEPARRALRHPARGSSRTPACSARTTWCRCRAIPKRSRSATACATARACCR